MPPTVIAPLVHLNGTSKEELRRQVQDAGSAVSNAIRALTDATPNHRDYYPLGESVWQQVFLEHAFRRQRLQAVLNELQNIAEQIADQKRDK